MRRSAQWFRASTTVRRLIASLLVIMAAPLAGLRAVPALASGTTYKLVRIASGLDQPVYMTQPPGDNRRHFIVEKVGVIRVLSLGTLLPTPFLNISAKVSTSDERGLLSMAFDPDFATNRRFYIYYTDRSGNIVVARHVTTASNPNRSGTREVVLVTIPHPTYDNHNGGQLQFDPVAARNGQAMLYFGTGDGGSAGDPNDNAQNLSSGLGKLFRIDVWAANPTKELYGYGLRNPWRFSFDRQNGDLRIGDVGQDSWEELDLVPNGAAPGMNFGWRKFEGNHLYHDETIDSTNLVWPFWEYPHDNGNCAVIGGYMYRGRITALRGFYLFGDLCSGNIWRQMPGSNPIRMTISGQVPDVVSFAEATSGTLYVISIDGSIWRLATA